MYKLWHGASLGCCNRNWLWIWSFLLSCQGNFDLYLLHAFVLLVILQSKNSFGQGAQKSCYNIKTARGARRKFEHIDSWVVCLCVKLNVFVMIWMISLQVFALCILIHYIFGCRKILRFKNREVNSPLAKTAKKKKKKLRAPKNWEFWFFGSAFVCKIVKLASKMEKWGEDDPLPPPSLGITAYTGNFTK